MIKQRSTTVLTSGQTLTVSQMGDILCNSASVQTYKMPAASDGLWFNLVNINSGVVRITDNSDVLLAVVVEGNSAIVFNDGTNWFTNYASLGINARIWRNSNQSINNITTTQIVFTQALQDDAVYWDGGNPNYVTIPFNGRYNVSVHGRFGSNSTGRRYAAAWTGSYDLCQTEFNATNGSATIVTASTNIRLTKGDKVYMRVWQNSGGNLNLESNQSSPILSITKNG